MTTVNIVTLGDITLSSDVEGCYCKAVKLEQPSCIADHVDLIVVKSKTEAIAICNYLIESFDIQCDLV